MDIRGIPRPMGAPGARDRICPHTALDHGRVPRRLSGADRCLSASMSENSVIVTEHARSPRRRSRDTPRPGSYAATIISRVRAIPRGLVCTYGDIDPHAPRAVGRILAT